MIESRSIAVIGGTGMLGRPVVEAIAARGVPVRVLTRGHVTTSKGVTYVQGEVHDPAALAALLDGCSAVHINLRGTSVKNMWRTEVEGTIAVVTAAAKVASLKRVGYLSGSGIEAGDPHLLPVRIKQAAEKAVRDSGLEWTIFRATHFMESLDLFVRGKRIELMTPQPLRYHYLAAADYAEIVAVALINGGAERRALTVMGPEAMTMADALAIYRARLAPHLAFRSTPTTIVRLAAKLTRNAALAHAAMLFFAFPRIPETGDGKPANILLGHPRTTLLEWCNARAA